MANKTMHHLVIKDNNYEILDAKNRANIAAEYSASSTYNVGDVVLYNGQLYKCTTAITTAEAWTAAHWTAVTVGEKVADLEATTNDLKDDLTAAQVELAKKANTDGYYEEMTVGNAEQLVSTVTNADDTPYNFRTTAGSADVGDRAYVDAIVGGTLSVNQLAPILSNEKWAGNSQFGACVFEGNKATYTITQKSGSQSIYISNVKGGIPLIKDHKYVVEFDATISQSTSSLSVNVMDTQWVSFPSVQANTKQHCAKVFNSANATGGNAYFGIYPSTGAGIDVGGTFVLENVVVIDLTQTFGTAIADYVYGLETATAGAGVSWLKANAPKIFNGGYIPFNAGTLQSVVGLSEKRNTGLNQFDKSKATVGSFVNTGGNVETDSACFVTDFIRVVPNTAYYTNHIIGTGRHTCAYVEYDSNKNVVSWSSAGAGNDKTLLFTTGASTNYIRVNVEATYLDATNINLHWDGEKDGTYEPYTVHTYAFDPTVELRGVPKLKDGKMYFDGDRYLPDGQIGRNIYEFVITDASVTGVGTASTGVKYATISIPVSAIIERTGSALMAEYVQVVGAPTVDKVFSVSILNAYVYDNTFTDLATAKTALVGKKIVYTLAEPTTETATPYNPVEIVDDFGTEEFITTSLVPVGHETRYAPNLRAKLEIAPDSPDGDGVYVVQQSNGENTYVSLGSTTVIQGILARLTALEGNTNEG